MFNPLKLKIIMKNYPINFIDGSQFKSEIGSFYYGTKVPFFPCGEKMYVLIDKKLYACIPKYVALAQHNGGSPTCGLKWFGGFTVAGLGDMNLDIYNGGVLFFKSIDDYNGYLKTGGHKFSPSTEDLKDVLRKMHGIALISYSSNYYAVKGWYMGPTKPEETALVFKDFWVDADGSHVTPVAKTNGSLKVPVYLTQEECIKANTADVVDFDTDVKEDEGEGIMDYTNNHNPELVDEINLKWDKFRPFFKPILCALYERDLEEIYNSDAFSFDGSMDDAFNELCDEWDFHASNYLQHIADDQDLETIVEFIRYDVVEKWS
jgi:hypothetical protein